MKKNITNIEFNNSPLGAGGIKVKACASVSNLCCGFDILGFAVNEPYDEMEISLRDEPGIGITHIDEYGLPTETSRNVAGVALQAMIDGMQLKHGFDVIINKKIKPGSGLGSSSASAAGVIVAANQLLGDPLGKKQMVKYAMEGEVVASGSRHADNIAPCVYGGITLIRDTASLDIIQLSAPPMFVAIVHPQIEIKTSYAREILPKEVPLKSAVKQWANVAGLVTGFLKSDYQLISRSLEDIIVEPVRSKLIPGFDEVKLRCKEVNVLGGGISGSGPSIFMLSEKEKEAKAAEEVMKNVYNKLGIEYKTYVTTINNQGIKA